MPYMPLAAVVAAEPYINHMKNLDIEITHHFITDELYSKRATFPADRLLTQHVHKFDHASALVRGTVLLTIDGVATEVTGPKMIMIEAGKQHSVRSLTPVVWHCIHITSESDPEHIDNELIA